MIVIDVSGRVSETEVVESRPGLDEAALQCVKESRFQPARKAGVAVGTVAMAPVRFSIYEQEKHKGCRKLRAAEAAAKGGSHEQ
jgi:TonB family protein